jgi:hypothetical protein
MLILEKFRNKYHQIWITVDDEKRNTKFDCRLKGEKQIVLHSNKSGPTPSLVLTVKIRQPSHEFTFGVGMTFVSYSLVVTPVV